MKRTINKVACHLRNIRKEVKETPMYTGQTWAFKRRADCVSQNTANLAMYSVANFVLEIVGNDTLHKSETQMKLKVLATQWALELNYPWEPYPGDVLFPELWN